MTVLYPHMTFFCPCWRVFWNSIDCQVSWRCLFHTQCDRRWGQAEGPVQFRSEGWRLLVFTLLLSVSGPSGIPVDSPAQKPKSCENARQRHAFPLHSCPRDSSFPFNTLAKVFLQAGDENQGSCQFRVFSVVRRFAPKLNVFVFFFN